MHLGYFISPTKSTLFPTQDMIHLGFGINSQTSSFYITEKYRLKFQALRAEMLERKTANERDLQRWCGKCCHLGLLFPEQSLFTYQCRRLLASATEERVALPQEALDEIAFWTFVDAHTEPVPFLLQQHISLTLYTDASGFAWGAQVQLPSGPSELRDYWSTDLFGHDICSKEALAVLFALQAISEHLYRHRVTVYVDNEGLVHAWGGLKSKTLELTSILQSLFLFCVDSRVSLKLVWIPTDKNPADAPSRVLDRRDATLSFALRRRLWDALGPFAFDLMALPSNVLVDLNDRPLPFFSLFPTPSSAGTDVFAQRPPASDGLYVFPPFSLVEPVIELMREWGVGVTLVLPVFPGSPPVWLTALRPYIVDSLVLFSPRAVGVLRFPSSGGFRDNLLPVPFGLTAFRCRFPPRPAPVLPVLSRPVRVLAFSDSMLRPLQSLAWPLPLKVLVHPYGGANIDRVLRSAARFSSSPCDALLLHAGVIDASNVTENFDAHCEFVSKRIRDVVASSFSRC